jgi:hypothetical protein
MNSCSTLFTLILCLLQLNFPHIESKGSIEILPKRTSDIALLFIIQFESDLEQVPAAIQTLNEKGIKATFFISQELTCRKEHVEIIKQIQKHHNHEVGLFFILGEHQNYSTGGAIKNPIPNRIYKQTLAFDPIAVAIYVKFINGVDILDYDYLESKGRFIIPKTENRICYSYDGHLVLVKKGIHEIDKILKEAAEIEGIKWYTASEGYHDHPEKWPDWRRLHVKVQKYY